MDDVWDGEGGRDDRDEGMRRVAGRVWIDLVAAAVVKYIPADLPITGEVIRRICETSGEVPLPHHTNAWGAATNALIKRGVIYDTGVRMQMQLRTSHARSTPIYKRRVMVDEAREA